MFKKTFDAEGIWFPQGFRVENKRVFLPKIGWISFPCSKPTIKKRKILGRVKNVTVKLEAGFWRVSFCTERDVQEPVHELMGDVVGIDVGVKRWAALADGTFYEGANAFQKHKNRLALLQRQLAKKVKFSKNWAKMKRKIGRLHHRIANVRNNQIHQASSTISKNHAVGYQGRPARCENDGFG